MQIDLLKANIVRQQEDEYEFQAQLCDSKVLFNDASLAYSHLMAVKKADGTLLRFMLNNATGTATVQDEDDSIFYPSILQDVDLRYKVSQDKVKEFIYINSGQANHSFTFNVLTENAELHFNDDNTISVIQNNKTIWTVEAPTAVDATGKEVPVNVYTVLDSYTISIDKDPSYVYPIIIDPTVSFGTATGLGRTYSIAYGQTYTDDYRYKFDVSFLDKVTSFNVKSVLPGYRGVHFVRLYRRNGTLINTSDTQFFYADRSTNTGTVTPTITVPTAYQSDLGVIELCFSYSSIYQSADYSYQFNITSITYESTNIIGMAVATSSPGSYTSMSAQAFTNGSAIASNVKAIPYVNNGSFYGTSATGKTVMLTNTQYSDLQYKDGSTYTSVYSTSRTYPSGSLNYEMAYTSAALGYSSPYFFAIIFKQDNPTYPVTLTLDTTRQKTNTANIVEDTTSRIAKNFSSINDITRKTTKNALTGADTERDIITIPPTIINLNAKRAVIANTSAVLDSKISISSNVSLDVDVNRENILGQNTVLDLDREIVKNTSISLDTNRGTKGLVYSLKNDTTVQDFYDNIVRTENNGVVTFYSTGTDYPSYVYYNSDTIHPNYGTVTRSTYVDDKGYLINRVAVTGSQCALSMYGINGEYLYATEKMSTGSCTFSLNNVLAANTTMSRKTIGKMTDSNIDITSPSPFTMDVFRVETLPAQVSPLKTSGYFEAGYIESSNGFLDISKDAANTVYKLVYADSSSESSLHKITYSLYDGSKYVVIDPTHPIYRTDTTANFLAIKVDLTSTDTMPARITQLDIYKECGASYFQYNLKVDTGRGIRKNVITTSDTKKNIIKPYTQNYDLNRKPAKNASANFDSRRGVFFGTTVTSDSVRAIAKNIKANADTKRQKIIDKLLSLDINRKVNQSKDFVVDSIRKIARNSLNALNIDVTRLVTKTAVIKNDALRSFYSTYNFVFNTKRKATQINALTNDVEKKSVKSANLLLDTQAEIHKSLIENLDTNKEVRNIINTSIDTKVKKTKSNIVLLDTSKITISASITFKIDTTRLKTKNNSISIDTKKSIMAEKNILVDTKIKTARNNVISIDTTRKKRVNTVFTFDTTRVRGKILTAFIDTKRNTSAPNNTCYDTKLKTSINMTVLSDTKNKNAIKDNAILDTSVNVALSKSLIVHTSKTIMKNYSRIFDTSRKKAINNNIVTVDLIRKKMSYKNLLVDVTRKPGKSYNFKPDTNRIVDGYIYKLNAEDDFSSLLHKEYFDAADYPEDTIYTVPDWLDSIGWDFIEVESYGTYREQPFITLLDTNHQVVKAINTGDCIGYTVDAAQVKYLADSQYRSATHMHWYRTPWYNLKNLNVHYIKFTGQKCETLFYSKFATTDDVVGVYTLNGAAWSSADSPLYQEGTLKTLYTRQPKYGMPPYLTLDVYGGNEAFNISEKGIKYTLYNPADPTYNGYQNIITTPYDISNLCLSTLKSEPIDLGDIIFQTPYDRAVFVLRSTMKPVPVTLTLNSKREIVVSDAAEIHTERIVFKNITLNLDTKKKAIKNISMIADTKLKYALSSNIVLDSIRETIKNTKLIIDSTRAVGHRYLVNLDTKRSEYNSYIVNAELERKITKNYSTILEVERSIAVTNIAHIHSKRQIQHNYSFKLDINKKSCINITYKSDTRFKKICSLNPILELKRRICAKTTQKYDVTRERALNASVRFDTNRSKGKSIVLNIDIKRKPAVNISVNQDTIRRITKTTNCKADTERRIMKLIQLHSDTVRKPAKALISKNDVTRKPAKNSIITSDTVRKAVKIFVASTQLDTLRQVIRDSSFKFNIDTKRRIIKNNVIASDTTTKVKKNNLIVLDLKRKSAKNNFTVSDTMKKIINNNSKIINLDTNRKITKSAYKNLDTKNSVTKISSVTLDTKKKTGISCILKTDSLREVLNVYLTTLNIYTLRTVYHTYNSYYDTIRTMGALDTSNSPAFNSAPTHVYFDDMNYEEDLRDPVKRKALWASRIKNK